MYSVNGVPLADNPEYGWTVQFASRPLGEFSQELANVSAPLRDGVAAGTPSSFVAPVRTFVVRTVEAHLETLLALLHGSGSLSRTGSTRVLPFETVAVSPVELATTTPMYDVTWTFRAPGVFWRDADLSTPWRSFTSAGGTWDLFSGISAPISDLVVLVEGPGSGPVRVTDSSGAWMQVTSPVYMEPYEAVVFYPLTGKAYKRTVSGVPSTIAALSSWAGGTLQSRLVTFGGPRRRFELTPRRGMTPDLRAARLTVVTTPNSPTIYVRARGAYLTP